VTSETDIPPASTLLDPEQARALLEQYGIPTPPQRVVESRDPHIVGRAAAGLNWPLVLKAIGPSVVHKSDLGGVRIGLLNADELERAAVDMLNRVPGLTGFLLQEQTPPGTELIVGCRRDPAFGPVVLVGLGGIWVEALGDVSLRLAPVSHAAARAMISELKGTAILDGYRGQPEVDRESLADLLVRVSHLACERDDLDELDLNPVIAGEDGLVAVDARIIVSGQPPEQCERLDVNSSSSVERLLAPKSIAIVGASEDRAKPGGRLLHYLLKHGYTGRLFPVNPRADEIMGHRSYPSVADLPETPDLACIVTPAPTVPGIVAECGERGVPSAIVFASGFGEAGEEGLRLQREMVGAARASGIRLCGPNTVGVVNASETVSMCAAFGMAFEIEQMPRGDIAFITQSGALGGSLLSRAWTDGIGFSYWVSSGNEADLTLSDYFSYLVDQPDARVIAMFMETLHDPASFIEAAHRARALGKRVVVYKTGVSEVAQRAVQSHTGSLAGDDRIYNAAFRETGVARVDDLQALVDAAVALSRQPLPKGRRVGVISASGGACSVIADECARYGLDLPLLRPETVERIREIIPPFGASQNPIDVTIEINRNPEMIGQATEVLLAGDEVDALVILMTTNADPPALRVAEGVIRAAQSSDKPVLVARVGAEFLAPASITRYREAGIPLVPMPDRVVKALRAMIDVAGV
jgi:acetate---CoA ligase (ADP-forming)